MKITELLHAVVWRYSDNSDGGIVRVFSTEESAHDLLCILRENSDTKIFDVVEVSWEDA
jgi:hypothetical protein